MDVQLYVYDLSQGLARQFSRQFLGTQIDAVYHTAIVLDSIEYFFGAGVQTTYAGTTHHGRPMEIVNLGSTGLPMEVILEYLESLKEIYTAESYDLFMHNCNNFSNDFAMFLVGKGIPAHITSLPQRVLDTPFGAMLRPQLDRAMRSVTQAPVNVPVQPVPKSVSTSPSSVLQHPHSRLNLQKLKSDGDNYVLFTKLPPLEKLVARLGTATHPTVSAIVHFLDAAHSSVPQESRLPSLPDYATWLRQSIEKVPLDAQFAAYDLHRIALADVRISAFFTEEHAQVTIVQLLRHVNDTSITVPYNLRIVTLHMGCNLFASKLSAQAAMNGQELVAELLKLALAGLLDEEHANVRTAAASLAYNIALSISKSRLRGGGDILDEESQVELVAAVIEALQREKESKQCVMGLVLTLGFLVYCAPIEGPLLELCRTLEVEDIVRQKEGLIDGDPMTRDIVCELLAKGL